MAAGKSLPHLTVPRHVNNSVCQGCMTLLLGWPMVTRHPWRTAPSPAIRLCSRCALTMLGTSVAIVLPAMFVDSCSSSHTHTLRFSAHRPSTSASEGATCSHACRCAVTPHVRHARFITRPLVTRHASHDTRLTVPLCSAEEEATCVKAVRSFLPHRTTIIFTHRSNGAAASGIVSPHTSQSHVCSAIL